VSWAEPDRRFAARVVEMLYSEADSPLRYRVNRLGGRSKQEKWILQAELFNEIHRWVKRTWVKIEKEGWNNTLVPAENSDTVLQIVRLDELSEPGLTKRKVGLLKVDAEGFDIAILFGAKNLLAASKPVIAFEYNRDNMDAIGEPGLRVFPYLDGLGYEGLLIYDSPGRYLLSATVQDMDLLSDLHEFLRPPTSGLYYLDFVAFPSAQRSIFERFRESERFGGDKDPNRFAKLPLKAS
jgi:hypothetical protein